MKGATRLLDGVSRGASSLARSVRSGALADALGPDRRGRHGSRWPYSLWLAQPYAKVTTQKDGSVCSSTLWLRLANIPRRAGAHVAMQ